MLPSSSSNFIIQHRDGNSINRKRNGSTYITTNVKKRPRAESMGNELQYEPCATAKPVNDV
jgi:hypothetical protein